MSTRAKAIAEQHVRQAIDHLVEARREMTLFEVEAFVRSEYPPNGNGGFVASTCEAMVRGSISPPLPGESNARFIAGPATPSKR
jgi:hypothetical protein